MKKTIFIVAGAVALVLIILAGTLFYFKNKNTEENKNVNEIPQVIKQTHLSITTPNLQQTLDNPFTLEGKATGGWFFEGDFPVKLLDANGKILALSFATAQEDWMTEDLVDFKAKISFENPTTETGVLILQKDNPSGLPENDASVQFPVKFKIEKQIVTIFLTNTELSKDTKDICVEVYPVQREVIKTQSIATATINELLKGPSQEEIDQGYGTSLNDNIVLNSLTIKDGVAKADFNSQLDYQVGGSCRVSGIYTQIAETLKQFSTVNTVEITRNGSMEDILQP
jgi:hypothetical protein